MPYSDDRLFFTDAGSGQAVVMIHGWTCDGSDWAWLESALRADHRTIVPDLRGHGRSAEQDGYLPQHFAADIAGLLTGLGVSDALGGIIASVLAVAHPSLVQRLVLVDPAYGADPDVVGPMLPAVTAVPHKIALASLRAFYGEATPSWLPVWHARRAVGTPEAVVRDTFFGMYSPDGLGIRSVGEPYLRQRSQPMLVVYSGRNAEQAVWERSLNAATTVDVWDGYGHFLFQEAPATFAARVKEWLTAGAELA
ncbi:MAG: alpha/beta hydrolase [Actinomycetota bacterium]